MDHCDNTNCESCKLFVRRMGTHCHVSATPEEIKENYEILFGKEEKHMGMFKKEDIKPGYLLVFGKKNSNLVEACRVTYRKDCITQKVKLSYFNGKMYGTVDSLSDDLIRSDGRMVIKIYGYANITNTHELSVHDREVIWRREESREMTLEEIEKALGYPVKIVK